MTAHYYYSLQEALFITVGIVMVCLSSLCYYLHYFSSSKVQQLLQYDRYQLKPLQKYFGHSLFPVSVLHCIWSIDPVGVYYIHAPITILVLKNIISFIVLLAGIKWAAAVLKVLMDLCGFIIDDQPFNFLFLYTPSTISFFILVTTSAFCFITQLSWIHGIWIASVTVQLFFIMAGCCYLRFKIHLSDVNIHHKLVNKARFENQEDAHSVSATKRFLDIFCLSGITILVGISYLCWFKLTQTNLTIQMSETEFPDQFVFRYSSLLFFASYGLLIYGSFVGLRIGKLVHYICQQSRLKGESADSKKQLIEMHNSQIY